MKEGIPKTPEEYREAEGITDKLEAAKKDGLYISHERDLELLEEKARRVLPEGSKEERVDSQDKKEPANKKMQIDPEHLRKIEKTNDLAGLLREKLEEAFNLTVGDELLRAELDKLRDQQIRPRLTEIKGKDPDSQVVKTAYRQMLDHIEGFIREASSS